QQGHRSADGGHPAHPLQQPEHALRHCRLGPQGHRPRADDRAERAPGPRRDARPRAPRGGPRRHGARPHLPAPVPDRGLWHRHCRGRVVRPLRRLHPGRRHPRGPALAHDRLCAPRGGRPRRRHGQGHSGAARQQGPHRALPRAGQEDVLVDQRRRAHRARLPQP
ncbi:hypothetical protein BN1708_018987, partial [Verticillium longisporum]